MSISQYGYLYDKTKSIGDQVNILSTEDILTALQDLNGLLDEAKKIDSAINIAISTTLIEENSLLHRSRVAIMERFLDLNNDVALKVRGKMAVLLEERNKIKNGRQGVSGYLSSSQNPTRFVNESA
ncbi:MAG: hypothetical protein HKP41_08100 [Desulfobacterales bacterium]|nr:hypothetical protein [Deltaproteobacteria bacterium]NNK94298.1 hypothetical protein [Desulfobacterales bacterium]